MLSPPDQQRLYEDLVQECERRQDASHRDIFLVLAADRAASNGRMEEAERLLQRLLAGSPHHLLRPFASFAQALQSSDIREYVEDLRQQFPPDWSDNLLAGWRRDSHARENGASPSVLDRLFSDEPEPVHDPFAGASDVGLLWPAEPEGAARALELPEQVAKPPAEPSPQPYVLHDKSATPGKTGRSPKKSRRGSPYDRPDYGPPIPQGPVHRDFVGSSIIYLLIGLVTLAGLALLGYVLARPFLKM